MKFSEYILLTEDKAHEIDADTAEHLIQKNCTNILQNGWHIFRGIQTKSEYLYGSGEFIEPRRSANTLDLIKSNIC